MPSDAELLRRGVLPIGGTPHLLFTFGKDPDWEPGQPPPGVTIHIIDPRLYIYVRDLVVEQQIIAGMAKQGMDATDACIEALLEEAPPLIPDHKKIFDVEKWYKGDGKVLKNEPSPEEKDSPKIRDGKA